MFFGSGVSAYSSEPRVTPVFTQQIASKFLNHASGRYFQFHGDISAQRLAQYAAVSDMFVKLVDKDFFRVKTRFPIQAFVLQDEAGFKRFLLSNYGVAMPPAYGMYLVEAGAFVTYDGSGLGTFTHEIMHPLVEESLPACPAWAMEGIPAFFEKFYGYVQDGQLHLKWGYQNPWRIDRLGPELTHLKLTRIVHGSQDTSEKRLVSMFLYQRGKLKKFLALVQADDRKAFSTHLEAAFEKPLKEIENDWQSYLQDIQNNRQQIMKLPLSQIFDTPQSYRDFAKHFGL